MLWNLLPVDRPAKYHLPGFLETPLSLALKAPESRRLQRLAWIDWLLHFAYWSNFLLSSIPDVGIIPSLPWRPGLAPPAPSRVETGSRKFLPSAVLCLAAQSCPTLCSPMDCSPPGSSVHRDSPGKYTGVGCHALLQGSF